MALEAPKLDERTFEDIFREARLRIPRYAPEWTDYNESDPGITLLQLFSWFSEMMLYQMNRMPELNYIKFLDLLGMHLKPSQSATAHLTFTADPKARETPIVPHLTRIEAPPTESGDPIIFETESGIGLVRNPLVHVQVFDGTGFAEITKANAEVDVPFQPFGWRPQVGNALYLGFEALVKDDQPIPAPAGRFPQEIQWRVFKAVAELRGKPQSCEGAGDPPVAPVTLVWEYRPIEKSRYWRRLDVFNDESVAFTREGYIQMQGPGEIAATQEGKVQDKCYWLRCRIEKGVYPAGTGVSIDFIRPNTVAAINLTTERQEVVGISNGLPHQSYTLRYGPVQPDSIKVETEIDGQASTAWKRVDDFLASKRDENHFMLDAVQSEIRFGDGINGRIPSAGATIVATEYRFGGGKAGNVGAGLAATMLNPPTGVKAVTNIRKAEGGDDAQSLEELKSEAPARIRNRDRAVTADDFTEIASRAGGVARATAMPESHPEHPGIPVPGAVTVVIVPDIDMPAPEPSADLIDSVCRYLNQYRLLTTEVFVKGPSYYAIKVVAKVQADAFMAADEAKRNINYAINELLDPLGRRFHPDPEHERPRMWAFGQDLYPSGFFSTILGVSGIRSVDNLELFVNDVPWEKLEKPIPVNDDELFFGKDHEITVIPYVDKRRRA